MKWNEEQIAWQTKETELLLQLPEVLYSKYRITRKIGSRVYLSYIPMQNRCLNVEQTETQKKKHHPVTYCSIKGQEWCLLSVTQ